MGNAQYLMKEFPLIDLFAMLYWKPTLSLADFLSAWGKGKDSSARVQTEENASLAEMDSAMTNPDHHQYAKSK